ncbi:RNA polymerase sigma factor [Sphingobacterium sp. BS-2]|uniref:RNA polymerase sigma factor n=1 Tax=Sphingobacterium sp. BS-2 TaxID=3377129 RepID=UPI0038FBE5A7
MKSSIDTAIQESTPILKNLACKFTKDPEERDDLVQETFVRSLKSLQNLVDTPKLISWLYVIMKNIYYNQYRRKGIRRNVESEVTSRVADHGSSRNNAESKFVMDDIQTTLRSLSKENYALISMYLEGYKYHEIATYFDIKEGTVKTRIHTIRKNLRRKLQVYRTKPGDYH